MLHNMTSKEITLTKHLSSDLTILHIIRVQETWYAKLLFGQLVSQTVVLKDILRSRFQRLKKPKKDSSKLIFFKES